MSNSRNHVPMTPPISKVLFEKCYRQNRSMSQLKGAKCQLGSSLDQGLNQPAMQSRILSNQSKRICKSEESAIDDATLTLPPDVSSVSSNETLNESVFDNQANSMNGVDRDEKLIEDDIEIAIPMSVSKPIVFTGFESSANARQRSSNSISSCEMALSSSLVDGEDSSNGNSIRNEENCEVFDEQEKDKSFGTEDRISTQVRNFEMVESNETKECPGVLTDTSRNCDTDSRYFNFRFFIF